MVEREKKADLICCLQVLLKTFIEEKNIRQLANVLKKHGIITSGQEKKVHTACKNEDYGGALEKLIAFVEKGDLGNLENALKDEEFPADAKAKMLLSLLVGVQDQNLIFVIKNWEKLSQCEDKLKHLVTDGSGDGDWVKRLVLAVFEEILQEKEEKPILNSITQAISNMDAEEKVMSFQIKRTGPEGTSETGDEPPGNDMRVGPPPAKKSKTITLKRPRPDQAEDEESKKQRADAESTLEANTAEQQTSTQNQKCADAGSEEPGNAQTESGDNPALEITREKPDQDAKETDAVTSPDSDKAAAEDSETANDSGSDSDPDNSNDVQSVDDQNDINKDSKNSRKIWRANEKKKNKRNKRKNKGKNQNPKPEGKVQPDQKKNDDSNTENSEKDKDKKHTVADEPGQSQRTRQEQPVTRSQTKDKDRKGKDNSEAQQQHNRENKEQSVILLQTDSWPIIDEEEDGHFVEIRAVVAGEQSLPGGTGLSMAFSESDWNPVEMAFNERKKFYYLRILCKQTNMFKFKFCYKTDRGTEYEKLPGDYYAEVNRVIYFREGETKWRISLNACLFEHTCWLVRCCNGMAKFLPSAKVITEFCNIDNDTSVLTDIFCWINCVKHGWLTDCWGYCSSAKPEEHVFVKILLAWLREIQKALSDNTTDSIHLVVITLAISLSFAQEKHRIRSRELLTLLFKMLRINKLDENACKEVYNMATKEHQGAMEAGLELPSFREAIQWVYRSILGTPNLDWLLTLPFYWFMVNGESKEEVLKPDSKRSTLTYARSSLPKIPEFDWVQVRQSCFKSTGQRKELLDMVPDILEIAKRNPWMIGTYHFMLNSKEFASLILQKEKHKIAEHFCIESALYQYLDGLAKGQLSQLETEQRSSFDSYFKERLDAAITLSAEADVSAENKKKDFDTCQTLLDVIIKHLKPTKDKSPQPPDVLWCLDVIVLKTVLWTLLLNLDDEEMKNLLKKLTEFLRMITAGINRRNQLAEYELEYWGKLLNVAWDIPEFVVLWKTELIKEIQNCINNFCSGNNENFLDFYVEKLGGMMLQEDVEKCLNDKAYQCAETLLSMPQQRAWYQKIKIKLKSIVNLPADTPRIIRVFDKLYMQAYSKYKPKDGDGTMESTSLRFLCSWSFSAQFYELFAGEWLNCFLPKTRDAIGKVSNWFQAVVKTLSNKTLTVNHLNVIMTNKERFLLVWGVLSPDYKKTDSSAVDDRSTDLGEVIDLCVSYLQEFKRTKAAIEDFVQVCNYADYGDEHPYAELEAKVKIDIQGMLVTKLVTVEPGGTPCSNDFFEINREQREEFEEIKFIKDSKEMFCQIFVKAVDKFKDGVDLDEEEIHWNDILQVWDDVKHQIFALVEKIDAGTMTLNEVLEIFQILKSVKKAIEFEVDLFYDFYVKYNRKNVDVEATMLENQDVRKSQIYNTFQLQHANEAVDVLLDLKDMLKLEGDFKALEERKEMIEDRENVELEAVPEELEIPEICGVSPENLEVLKKFMAAKEVIVWLQQKMKNMNEVKVMCDLAMILAGDGAIELDRVSSLLSAVMGFAPLVFWTEEGRTDAGSQKLLECCKNVWENEKGIDKLLDKWEDIKDHLQWFKEVENFYGSVEKSSLNRAQEINQHGVYRIAKVPGGGPLTVENCISLMLPSKTKSDSALKLGLGELHELQSKLMLIAGEAEKGQHDVSEFVAVLTSVQKLAEVYVQLLTSGCMLFVAWEAVIMCHGGDELSIQIQFIDDAPPIIGNGKHTEVDNLTKMLKASHTKWEEHVSDKRIQFYHLNEYSIRQIMYLCHELANLDVLEEVPEQVLNLITFVRKDFDIDDLQKCLEDARSSDHIMDVNVEAGVESPNDTKNKWRAVRNLLSQENITEQQAKAAVQAAGYNDLSSCSLWILENGMDEEMIQEYAMNFDNDRDLVEEESEVVYSVFDGNSGNTLKSVILKLQKGTELVGDGNFLDLINTICTGYLDETITMNLQDHLSIGLLGGFLDNLNKESRIHRNLLPGLHPGRPNLLICEEDEILPTVLSLYMHDDNQPLPNRSEVLICSDTTTNEEMEMFLRRAMCQSQYGARLIYILAFADKLNYTASLGFENIFTKLTKTGKINENYQLVILLSKQQHYLTNCFDKYIVDGKWSQPTGKIQSYLKHHLQVDDSETMSAASVTEGNYMVKVVTASRSGVGKSLYVQRLMELLEQRVDVESCCATIRLLESKLDVDYVIEKLGQTRCGIHNERALLVHVDLTPAVQHGIESFAFNLFVLGSIQGSDGRVWKIRRNHLYAVEMTDFGTTGEKRFSGRHILNLLPCVTCCAPHEVLTPMPPSTGEILGMDRMEFLSQTFQRPFQYLMRFEMSEDLDEFTYQEQQGTETECIEVLLRHCCIENPSWAQLRHFCSFLNVQLKNCEKSVFCTSPHIKPLLAGLKVFAVKFMIRMAQDFATPSLEISDLSVRDSQSTAQEDRRGFLGHQLRRKWEETSHPYVFFNEDGQTMTFINVRIDQNGFLLNQDGSPVEVEDGVETIATPDLVTALKRQGFDLSKNFDEHPRTEKLRYLCQVLGIQQVFDPDPTYELTTDNVLKILAIYMRFRCQIPVIIMGETGCGKTRLVEFMSKLKAGDKIAINQLPGTSAAGENTADEGIKNMITLKIHGGITVRNIHQSVKDARSTERRNRNNGDDFTVLFYDEANTTEAIYAIKEVMCDKSIDGKSFTDSKLQIVAACNPYKKLSAKAIKKLEDSGLGYRIRTSETTHLFGNIPVRSLVYRVVALPPSMQPFVWDFGQLGDEAEKIYIQQMTRKLAQKLGLSQRAIATINDVLSSCQQFMRTRTDECRYVSLRDVERCMTAYEWFNTRRESIYPRVADQVNKRYEEPPEVNIEIRTLIQTVGVCYHASLDSRELFREQLAACLNLPGIDDRYIEIELASCQTTFLRNVRIGDNIACNEALRENVFMMAVCADMKIPLFLIGKPGSSKSLAKTIVTNNMQGQASHAPLYRRLKQIHILSYQCSALTDAEGIERVFSQCSQLQKKQNPDTYTAVVVLDEIGLAEDSPNMPLKVLHPLLERRSTDLNTVAHRDTDHVGFVGISNWALDPAKMNRGIFLTRNRPTENDLKKTGKEISRAKKGLWRHNEDLFDALTQEYLKMYQKQKVEYFGLRDYYSLMKMICGRCTNSDADVKFLEVVYAILRNFSGGEKSVVKSFLEEVRKVFQISEHDPTPLIPIQNMIEDNLRETDSRFLLLLANQFSVVTLLQSCIEDSTEGAQVVFGSSFPGDHSYTQICQNMSRIRASMETGKTVILLNMASIHESLYDALNQHFVTFGGQNYVDLGLGGHRVKCRIAEKFRLIVIEKKEVVNREYPIPLINRLEKHHFNSDSLLTKGQHAESKKLKKWATDFVRNNNSFTCHHAFVGFHDDTISSVVLTSEGDFEDYKSVLLQCCSMDAILRLPESRLHRNEAKNLQDVYLKQQHHDSLSDVLRIEISQENQFSILEISSFSGVLSKKDVDVLHAELDLPERSIVLLSLEQFHTQDEYSDRLNQFIQRCFRQATAPTLLVLLIQCAQAQSHAPLIACARHILMNKIREVKGEILKTGSNVNATVALLLSTEREGERRSKMDALALQPTRETKIIHVDELKPADDHIARASNFIGKSLHDVFEAGKQELESERGLVSLLNIRSLLVDCVCESVARVKSQAREDDRYLKRVEILMNLCSREDTAGDHFRKIVLKKIVQVYAEMEEENDGATDWVIEKANDRESLQEGGTFRKTLWLCLKEHMSHFLSYVVSVVDRCNNLDLIAKDPQVPWELEMWLGMFDRLEILWQNIRSATKIFIPRSRTPNICKLPFSFLVIDYLEAQWSALESHHGKNLQESFIRLFREYGMKRIVDAALKSATKDVMKHFISDLVGTLYHAGTDDVDEITLVESIVFDTAWKSFTQVREEEYFANGDEIAIIFLAFKTLSKKLEKFSEVLQCCPRVLQKSSPWMTEQKNSEDFILHVLALRDALTLLKTLAEKIQDPRTCVEWIDLARTFKKMFVSVTAIISDEDVLAPLKSDWMGLSLVDLLLLQLLPPAHLDDALFRNFVQVIAPHVKIFWKASLAADARSYNFLRIVLNVLKRCFTDVNLKLLINWKDVKCKICSKRVQKPTFLPCRHFACENCILLHVRSGGRCMACNSEIPEDFNSIPAHLDENGENILKKMRSNCTSFFLEYLRQFCFKNIAGASGRMVQQVERIIKELIVELSDEDNRTQLDSTSLDLNINTKSSILQTLLRHDKPLVVKELNRWLEEAERDAKNSLITVLLKTYQQKILVNAAKIEENKEKLMKFWQDLLGKAWRGILQIEDSPLDVENLQRIAELRCAFMHFISLVDDKMKGVEYSDDEQGRVDFFLNFCMDLLTSINMPQVIRDFVLKSGCHKFGTQWFHQLAEQDDFKELIPTALQQAAENGNIDYWALLGEEYIRTKSVLYQTEEANYRREMAAILEDTATDMLPYLLAITSWCDKKEQDVKDLTAAILRQNSNNDFFMKFLLEKKDNLKSLLEYNMPTSQAEILYQLVIIVVTATTIPNDIMKGFYELMTNPQSAQSSFLPAMPEDIYFAIPADYRVENSANTSMYTCPKGHLYSVNKCTRPLQQTTCPTCRSTIGGTNHRPAPGNVKVTKTPQSQIGYKVAQYGENVSTGAERMSAQGAAVTQFILHSCLLAATLNHRGPVRTVHCSEQQQFLIGQLQANLRDLSRSLARNADDAVLVLHRILLRMMKQGPRRHVEHWLTLDARKAWEEKFRQEYLLPVFQNLEREITEAQQMMRQAEEAGRAPLTRLIQEIPDDDEIESMISWEQESLWNIIEHPTSAHLIQVLEDQMEKTSGEVLQVILQTPDLHFVKYLENILRLQQRLTERYQYQIDMKESDQKTLRDHIEDGGHHDENAIKEYISAWNEMFKSLQAVAPDYLSEYFEPISLDSPLSMVLPSIRGRGQCAKILAEYLIDIQNQFLSRCVEVIKPAQKLKDVEVHQLTASEFVCIQKHKDLLTLINMHTNYTIAFDQEGRHHVTSYNIEALEKQVREKFVMCKKIIKKNTVPCMNYLQDVGIGSDWKKVVSTINQGPLTAKLTQDIDRIVEKSHSSDLCEGVRTLTNAISFLAMVKTNPFKLLCEFLEKDLQLPSSRTLIIPRSAQITHVLSIYQRLTWHKSIKFTQQGLDPYKEALDGIKQEEISEKIVNATLKAFKLIDIAVFQQRVNEMLITGTGIENPDWTLTENVFPYVEFLDKSEDDSWYSKLPEELCNKHLGHLFQLSVEGRNEN